MFFRVFYLVFFAYKQSAGFSARYYIVDFFRMSSVDDNRVYSLRRGERGCLQLRFHAAGAAS